MMEQVLPLIPPVEAPGLGVAHFWAQGDMVSHAVALVLLAMSLASWTLIVWKTGQQAVQGRAMRAADSFWQAASLEQAVADITSRFSASFMAHMAVAGMRAAQQFDAGMGGIGAQGERAEFLTRCIRQSLTRSTAQMEAGLTVLASVGAVAPFVGLFGTVWGIYHALIAIAGTGSAGIATVSGPVGEALIMTAAGLFVAIPAVLAYNAFARFNRLALAELDGFAHDLFAFLNSGVTLPERATLRAVRG